jgi:hypothetical protein
MFYCFYQLFQNHESCWSFFVDSTMFSALFVSLGLVPMATLQPLNPVEHSALMTVYQASGKSFARATVERQVSSRFSDSNGISRRLPACDMPAIRHQFRLHRLSYRMFEWLRHSTVRSLLFFFFFPLALLHGKPTKTKIARALQITGISIILVLRARLRAKSACSARSPTREPHWSGHVVPH